MTFGGSGVFLTEQSQESGDSLTQRAERACWDKDLGPKWLSRSVPAQPTTCVGTWMASPQPMLGHCLMRGQVEHSSGVGTPREHRTPPSPTPASSRTEGSHEKFSGQEGGSLGPLEELRC